MEFLIAILLAAATFALLAGLGLVFGVLEHTTDKEFRELRELLKLKKFKALRELREREKLKDSQDSDDSPWLVPRRERNWIVAFAVVMTVIYAMSALLYSVIWLNWIMLVIAIGITVVYFVWTIWISNHLRELVIGGALIAATWLVLSSLCANLCAPGDINAGPFPWVRGIIIAFVVALMITVCRRIYLEKRTQKRQFNLEDHISKEGVRS